MTKPKLNCLNFWFLFSSFCCSIFDVVAFAYSWYMIGAACQWVNGGWKNLHWGCGKWILWRENRLKLGYCGGQWDHWSSGAAILGDFRLFRLLLCWLCFFSGPWSYLGFFDGFDALGLISGLFNKIWCLMATLKCNYLQVFGLFCHILHPGATFRSLETFLAFSVTPGAIIFGFSGLLLSFHAVALLSSLLRCFFAFTMAPSVN